MITLKQALKVCDIRDNELVCIRERTLTEFPLFLTGKGVRDRYDLRRTKVERLRPRFVCGEYEGWILQVKELHSS